MKEIKVVFEKDPSTDHIEVTVRAPEKDAEVEALLERIPDHPPDTILAADRDGAMHKIDLRGVVSISANGKHSQIVTENGVFFVRQALQSVEEALDGRFVRISRFEIVNVDKVLKFDFTLAGTLRLEFAGGTETWASRRNIPLIRKKLTERK